MPDKTVDERLKIMFSSREEAQSFMFYWQGNSYRPYHLNEKTGIVKEIKSMADWEEFNNQSIPQEKNND